MSPSAEGTNPWTTSAASANGESSITAVIVAPDAAEGQAAGESLGAW